MVPDVRNPRETALWASRSVYDSAVEVILAGIAVILPAVITIYILDAAMRILVSVLDPIVRGLILLGVIPKIQRSGVVDVLRALGLYNNVSSFLAQLIALVLLAVIVVGLGVAGRHRYGDRLIDVFDRVFMSLPGIGAVYKSFRRMSDAVMESEMEHFRSVKLVEFPRDGTYVIGFETARPPASIRDGIDGDGPRTLFLPLAPNPVMGGFLTHVPEERIVDIDMTVEEGVRNIITSGIATQEPLTEEDLDEVGLSEEDLDEVGLTEEDLVGVEDDPDGEGTTAADGPPVQSSTSARGDASGNATADGEAVAED